MITTLLLLLPVACTPAPGPDDSAPADTDTDADTDSDTDSDTDADTDTDADSDADMPDETGFELDGAWYPLVDGSMFCQPTGAIYTFSSGALRDGTGTQGNGYAYFGDPPPPGGYTLAYYDYSVTEIPAGQASIGFLDFRDSSFWWSDGTAGTLDVYDAGAGALDVVWHDVALHNGAGGARTSVEGWMRCTP